MRSLYYSPGSKAHDNQVTCFLHIITRVLWIAAPSKVSAPMRLSNDRVAYQPVHAIGSGMPSWIQHPPSYI